MSKTAVAHKSALCSTNIWHSSIPQAGFVSKGEHGIITQKAHFSHSKAATVTDTCHCLLCGWHPLGSAYLRSAYCCLKAKIQLGLWERQVSQRGKTKQHTDKHLPNHPPFMVSSAARRCTPDKRMANTAQVSPAKLSEATVIAGST